MRWIWWQCLAGGICWGSGSLTGQRLRCLLRWSCGEHCVSRGAGDVETLCSCICTATWKFSSGQLSSEGCRPRGLGSGSTWPYGPPSEGWPTGVFLQLWCSVWWRGSSGEIHKTMLIAAEKIMKEAESVRINTWGDKNYWDKVMGHIMQTRLTDWKLLHYINDNNK